MAALAGVTITKTVQVFDITKVPDIGKVAGESSIYVHNLAFHVDNFICRVIFTQLSVRCNAKRKKVMTLV